MDVLVVKSFLLGGVALGSLAASLFFWKFWQVTADRFFLFFALSFAVETLGRTVLGLFVLSEETEPLIYSFRLVSYGLILVAIVDKNRTQRQRPSSPTSGSSIAFTPGPSACSATTCWAATIR